MILPLSLIKPKGNQNPKHRLSAAELLSRFEAKTPSSLVCQTDRTFSIKNIKSPKIQKSIHLILSPSLSHRLLKSIDREKQERVKRNSQEKDKSRLVKTKSQTQFEPRNINICPLLREIDQQTRRNNKQNVYQHDKINIVGINSIQKRDNLPKTDKALLSERSMSSLQNTKKGSMIFSKQSSNEKIRCLKTSSGKYSKLSKDSQTICGKKQHTSEQHTFSDDGSLFSHPLPQLLPHFFPIQIKTESDMSISVALEEAKKKLYKQMYALDQRILNQYDKAPDKKGIILLMKRKLNQQKTKIDNMKQ